MERQTDRLVADAWNRLADIAQAELRWRRLESPVANLRTSPNRYPIRSP